MISLTEIEKLAALARLELDTTEKEKLRQDVGAILEYVSQINAFSGTATKDTRRDPSSVNVMREDATSHEGGVFTEALLRAAPQREGQYIKVKKIL